MYKIIIIAEPQKQIVINVVDLDKKTTISRVNTFQPQLMDYIDSLMSLYDIDQIGVCGPKVYTTKIISDISKQYPQVEVEEIN